HAYANMQRYYAMKNLIKYMMDHPDYRYDQLCDNLKGERISNWVNMGGQLMPEAELDQIRAEIGSGTLTKWDDIHARYDLLWDRYPLDKQKHAYATLCRLYDTDCLSSEQWEDALK